MKKTILILTMLLVLALICILALSGMGAGIGGAVTNVQMAQALEAQAKANEAQAHALTAQTVGDAAGDILLIGMLLLGLGIGGTLGVSVMLALHHKQQGASLLYPNLPPARLPLLQSQTESRHYRDEPDQILTTLQNNDLWGEGWE